MEKYYENKYQKALVLIYEMCNENDLNYASLLYNHRVMNEAELIEELRDACCLTDNEISDIMNEVL